MTLSIQSIKDSESDNREGCVDEWLKSGVADGDTLTISPQEYRRLRTKYNGRNFGDMVALVAKPIARIIDGAFGTDLQNCESCAERQQRLNSMFQSKPKE